MTFQSPSDYTLIAQHIDPQSASSGAKNGTAVNLAGWDGVMFIMPVGAMTATGTLDAKAQHSTTSIFTSAVDTTNAALTQVLAASGGSSVYIIDVKTQTVAAQTAGAQYARLVMTPATAASVFGAVSVLYRRSGALPPTQNAVQIVSV